jgi:hypothetical protein
MGGLIFSSLLSVYMKSLACDVVVSNFTLPHLGVETRAKLDIDLLKVH